MTVTLSGAALLDDLRQVSRARRVKNAVMTALMGLSFAAVAVVLAFVLFTVVSRGIAIVAHEFPAWFTDDISTRTRRRDGGMKAAIVGTLVITAVATIIAVPLGVAGAVYLNEYGKASPFARALRFLTNVMAGVPSIVMGLFLFVVVVVPLGRDGLSGFAGALALAALMLPIVVRSTEEMLRLVPQHLRDASYALGATESRTTMSVVLPGAAPGIISGCLLAVARAAGETAPLIFPIGAARASNWNPFDGTNTALSMQIYANAKQSLPVPQERAWGAALTLIAMAFLFMVTARLLTARLGRGTK